MSGMLDSASISVLHILQDVTACCFTAKLPNLLATGKSTCYRKLAEPCLSYSVIITDYHHRGLQTCVAACNCLCS